MMKTTLESFEIIGISIRTTNEKNQSSQDIPALWDTFMSQGIFHNIPNKIDDTIYALYTDYESDHTEGYTTVLGCKVKNLETIPEGMVGKSIQGGTYSKFMAKGDVTKGLIYEQWVKIWKTNLNRKYTTDFETYGVKAQNPADAEVDIFVAVA